MSSGKVHVKCFQVTHIFRNFPCNKWFYYICCTVCKASGHKAHHYISSEIIYRVILFVCNSLYYSLAIYYNIFLKDYVRFDLCLLAVLKPSLSELFGQTLNDEGCFQLKQQEFVTKSSLHLKEQQKNITKDHLHPIPQIPTHLLITCRKGNENQPSSLQHNQPAVTLTLLCCHHQAAPVPCAAHLPVNPPKSSFEERPCISAGDQHVVGYFIDLLCFIQQVSLNHDRAHYTERFLTCSFSLLSLKGIDGSWWNCEK